MVNFFHLLGGMNQKCLGTVDIKKKYIYIENIMLFNIKYSIMRKTYYKMFNFYYFSKTKLNTLCIHVKFNLIIMSE